MKKLIDIPENIKVDLNILAAKAETNLTLYIKNLLVNDVTEARKKGRC